MGESESNISAKQSQWVIWSKSYCWHQDPELLSHTSRNNQAYSCKVTVRVCACYKERIKYVMTTKAHSSMGMILSCWSSKVSVVHTFVKYIFNPSSLYTEFEKPEMASQVCLHQTRLTNMSVWGYLYWKCQSCKSWMFTICWPISCKLEVRLQ